MPRQRPGHFRIWLCVMQVILLLAMTALPAAAATTAPPSDLEWVQLLRTYGIVRGDNFGNLNLEKPITRAEMITIAVRALGAEEDAKLFHTVSLFSDATGHWAQDNITYAAVKKLIQGDGNGTVRPNDQINYAEALTLILRLVGKEPVGGIWPTNVILAANDLGLLPPGVTASNIKEPAIRQAIFRSMAIAVSTIQTADGKTFLQKYVDTQPPTLSVNPVSTPTKDVTASVSGTTKDAVSVSVNDVAATLTNGAFTASVPLAIGQNTVTVKAVDLAGNTATQQVSIVRQSPVARLEVTGPASLRAGETGTYNVVAFDDKGTNVPVSDVRATVAGNIGTFEAKTGTLTAGTATASGSITFSVGTVSKKIDVNVLGLSSKVAGIRISTVNNGLSVPLTRPMTVEVKAVDVDSQLVADDNGREITLEATGTGLTVTQPKVKTKDGVATFTVLGTTAGQITLTARSANVSPSILSASFGTATRIVLKTDTTSLVIGGANTSARIYAELRDDNGSLVTNNTGSDIIVTLTQQGAVGDFTDGQITIQRGASTSTAGGGDGYFVARNNPGQVLFSGIVASGHPYSIDPATVWITYPSVGSAGSRMQILNINPALTPNGAPASIILRVVDGNGTVVTTGNYAFRIKVDTSNNEPKTNGLPAGVTLTLGGTSYIPVDTGAAPSGNYVYGRTVNGQATLQLGYDKSGVVTLTPVMIGGASTAYGSDGSVGPADYAGGLTPVSDRVLFSGTVSALKLTVDSALGKDQTSGALNATSGGYFILRATVLDQFGGRVPGATNAITLVPANAGGAQPDNTTPPAFPSDSRNASDGIAEFTVYAKATVGCDTYKVTTSSGTIASPTVDLCVRNAVPADPAIITIRGTSGTNYRVRNTDTGMEIELTWAGTGNDSWVNAIVYQDGGQIYTSDAVDMSSPAPRIVVPRQYLTGGQHTYSVALKNATGTGNRSANSAPVTVDYESGNYGFTSAKYDATPATGHKLYVYAYGLATNGIIDPAKLTLRDASQGSLDLQGATWSIINSSQFVIDLSSAPAKMAAVESQQYSGGDVTLEAASGWYYSQAGASGAAVTAKPVGPMADITAVTFDVVTNRIQITGQGFNTGTIDITQFSITQGTNSLPFNSTNVTTWTRNSDTSITVTLTSTGAATLKDSNKFNGSDVLTAGVGWLSDGSFKTRAVPSALQTQGGMTGIPVSAQVTVTSITYVKKVTGANAAPAQLIIIGSGFFSGGTQATKGSVDLTKLSIKDMGIPDEKDLTGTNSSVDIISDGEIHITLDDTKAQVFEGTYSGSDIFVIGATGWFKDFQNRSAGAIQDRYFRLAIN